jgi:hypothetical protein
MAQDQTDKRRNIATNAIAYATQLWDALLALKELSEERAIAGNFVDTDFDGTDMKHLTPFMIGSLLDTHAPAIYNFVADAGTPARLDILLEVRR